MKKIVSAVAALTIAVASYAQPSDDVVKQIPMKAGAIETRFTSEVGTVHTTLTEKWYERIVESKWKTDSPGIYRWERIEYRYDYVGGKWVYKTGRLNAAWFDGVPNPTAAEVVELMKASKVGYQGAYYEAPIFKLADDPKWNWHTLNSVGFMVEAVYWKKLSYTEIQKVKATFPIRLYKDSGNGTYNANIKEHLKNSKWLPLRIDYISVDYGKEEVLETKTISEDDMKNMLELQGSNN